MYVITALIIKITIIAIKKSDKHIKLTQNDNNDGTTKQRIKHKLYLYVFFTYNCSLCCIICRFNML